MDDHFDLLEQKVQKAAARLRELKAENTGLRAELRTLSARAEKAERAAREGGGSTAGADEVARVEAAASELAAERREIRARVAKLVELLERLE